jgi:hypothetical protein
MMQGILSREKIVDNWINGRWGRVEQPPIKYNKKVISLAELLSTIENLAGKI